MQQYRVIYNFLAQSVMLLRRLGQEAKNIFRRSDALLDLEGLRNNVQIEPPNTNVHNFLSKSKT